MQITVSLAISKMPSWFIKVCTKNMLGYDHAGVQFEMDVIDNSIVQ